MCERERERGEESECVCERVRVSIYVSVSRNRRFSSLRSRCMIPTAATRWSTNLSWKVNLPHAIDFRAACGATLEVGKEEEEVVVEEEREEEEDGDEAEEEGIVQLW